MLKLFLKFSLGSWIAAALSIFTLPIVTALIRPEEFGKAAMFTLVMSLAGQVAQLGCDQSYARFFYGKDGKAQGRLLYSALLWPLATSLLIAVILVLMPDTLSALMFGAPVREASYLLAAAIPLAVLERFSSLAIRLQKRALSYSLLRLALSFAVFVTTVGYALLVRPDFMALALAQVVGLAVVFLVGAAVAHSLWRDVSIDRALARNIVRYGLPFVPAIGALWIFEGADRIMLRFLSNFTEIGLFSAGYRFVTLITLVTASFTTFWVPVTFELFERDPDEAIKLGSKAIEGMTGLLIVAGCAVLFVRELVILLFASDYRAAIAVMPFLLFVPILLTLSEVTVGGINYAKRPQWHFVIAAIAGGANLAMNALLIPQLGARGAAISTAIAYLLFFALRTVIAQRYMRLHIDYVRMVVAIAAFAFACAVATAWPHAAATYGAVAIAAAITIALYRRSMTEALLKVRPAFDRRSNS